MKIKELFSKSIERPINPAVVVSKLDVETIKVEIEEYVFTQDLMENLFCFLNSFLSEGQDKAVSGLMATMVQENPILLNTSIIV